ncbi:MAG: hypothetical protein VX875_11445 [Pseudomonadota bacterium]|nr:hypothetical protein [Pseudomonadota bacterium]
MSGRPKTGFITKLKTVVWAVSVAERVLDENARNNVLQHESELASGLSSTNKLDSFFNENGSKIWTKLLNGTVSPVTKIKTVESRLPNTSIYFLHPIWDILNKKYVNEEDLYIFYQELNIATQDIIKNKCIDDVVNKFDKEFHKKFNNILDLYSFLLFNAYQSKFQFRTESLEFSYLALLQYSELIINSIGSTGYYVIKLLELHFQLESNSRLLKMGANFDFHLKQIGLFEVVKTAFKNKPQRYNLLKNHFEEFENEFFNYKFKLASITDFHINKSEKV